MVILDVKTRWNSTYDMLVTARELKEVSLFLFYFYFIYNNKIKNYWFIFSHLIY